MRCLICTHADKVAINKLLLERANAGSGVLMALAQKLGISRQVLWRHKKRCLGMATARAAKKRDGSLEQRARELAAEADRLQLLAEHGMEAAVFERAMRALSVRVKLLEMEARLVGRLKGGKSAPITAQNIDAALREAAAVEAAAKPDPEEEARLMREYQELCEGKE